MNFISILEPEKVQDKWPDRAPAYFLDLNIDQILKLEWKYLMPLALVNLLLMTVVVAFGLYL